MKKKSLVPKRSSSFNDVVMTSENLGKRIIDHFPIYITDKILEPCIGDGVGFYKYITERFILYDWCEVSKGRDYFNYNEKVDYVITNPPYSIYSNFLEHSFKISNNVIFLYLIPGVFFKKRLRLVKEYGFGIKELIYIDNPENFPKFGFQLGVVWYQKNYNGDIKITDWRE